MGLLGLVISLAALIFLGIGFIPFLGWLNWFTTLPLAVTGAVVCLIVTLDERRNTLALTGLLISLGVFTLALLRLRIGCGVI